MHPLMNFTVFFKKKKLKKIRHHVALPISIWPTDSVPSPLAEQGQPVWNEMVAGARSQCQKTESMTKAPVCKHTLCPLKGFFILPDYVLFLWLCQSSVTIQVPFRKAEGSVP